MIPDIRRRKLIELLKTSEILYLPDIVVAMNTSESTIRRDLKLMAMNGEVELLRGGGVQLPQHNSEMNMFVKMQLNESEKLKIAREASSLIYPGDVVFLDPSSINYLLIDFINDPRITVVTNSIIHIGKLLEKDMNCVFLGGQVKQKTSSCIGPMAEKMMRDLRFSKCFLGANGVNRTAGITNHDPREQSIKQLAIRNSARVFFLIDSVKYGTEAMCRVAGIEEHSIITDSPWEGCEDLTNLIIAK